MMSRFVAFKRLVASCSRIYFLPSSGSFRFLSSYVQTRNHILHSTTVFNRQLKFATSAAEVVTDKNKKYTEISRTDLIDLISTDQTDDAILLIDVRDHKDTEVTGVIPTAINIPINEVKSALKLSSEEFQQRYGRTKPSLKCKNIIFYGLKEVKSNSACEIAHSLGFKGARSYPGGWQEWSKANE